MRNNSTSAATLSEAWAGSPAWVSAAFASLTITRIHVAYQPMLAELRCPKCISARPFPRNLAPGNDLTHVLSAIPHLGRSCGSEPYTQLAASGICLPAVKSFPPVFLHGPTAVQSAAHPHSLKREAKAISQSEISCTPLRSSILSTYCGREPG